MKLNKKNVLKIGIITFIAAILLPFLLIFSILNIYDCAGQNLAEGATCEALGSAQTKIEIGLIIQMALWSLFLIAATVYLWLVIRKKP